MQWLQYCLSFSGGCTVVLVELLRESINASHASQASMLGFWQSRTCCFKVLLKNIKVWSWVDSLPPHKEICDYLETFPEHLHVHVGYLQILWTLRLSLGKLPDSNSSIYTVPLLLDNEKFCVKSYFSHNWRIVIQCYWVICEVTEAGHNSIITVTA